VLPESRPRTYDGSTPLVPGDLNDIFDAIISGKHGVVEHVMQGIDGVGNTNFAYVDGAGGSVIQSTGAATLMWTLPCKVGDRLREVRFSRFGDGAVDILNAHVRRVESPSAGTNLESTGAINNVAAAWNETTIVVDPMATLLTGESFELRILVNATGLLVTKIRTFWDRP
jgi:hypothetical protein